MSVEESDVVLVEGWGRMQPFSGYHVKVCEVVEKTETTVRVIPKKVIYLDGRELREVQVLPADQREMECSATHLEKPIDQRLRELSVNPDLMHRAA